MDGRACGRGVTVPIKTFTHMRKPRFLHTCASQESQILKIDFNVTSDCGRLVERKIVKLKSKSIFGKCNTCLGNCDKESCGALVQELVSTSRRRGLGL